MPEDRPQFDRAYYALLSIATILLLPGLLLNLGLQPLLLEEPRRALITMEMLANDNLWVPRLFGELYYNKPPVFNWVLMAFAALSGGLNEWAMRLPTVLSLLGMGLLVFLAGRRYISRSFGWIAGLLTVCSVDLLFYFSTLGEIDLFYSFITFAGILSVFYFYDKKQIYTLFLSVYCLAAIGFLTKGVPSILFAGLTVVVYLGYKRSWSYLFSFAHLTGIISFLAIAGGYYLMYAQFEDPRPFLHNLWAASANRSPLGESWWQIPKHLLTFPLDTLKNLLPASFLLVFGLGKRYWVEVWRQPLVQFAILAFAANYLVYWISPGSRQRYLYMLYPLAVLVLTYLYYSRPGFRLGQIFLQVIALSGSAVIAIAGLALSFFPLENLPGLPLAIGIAFSAGGGLLFAFLWRSPPHSLPGIIIVLALARLFFDLTVLPQRAVESGAVQEKRWAQEVAAYTKNAPLHLVNGHRAPFSFTFYLNQSRGDILKTVKQYRENAYYILDNQEPPGWNTHMDFGTGDDCYYLGKFTERPNPAFFREREQDKAVLTE